MKLGVLGFCLIYSLSLWSIQLSEREWKQYPNLGPGKSQLIFLDILHKVKGCFIQVDLNVERCLASDEVFNSLKEKRHHCYKEAFQKSSEACCVPYEVDKPFFPIEECKGFQEEKRMKHESLFSHELEYKDDKDIEVVTPEKACHEVKESDLYMTDRGYKLANLLKFEGEILLHKVAWLYLKLSEEQVISFTDTMIEAASDKESASRIKESYQLLISTLKDVVVQNDHLDHTFLLNDKDFDLFSFLQEADEEFGTQYPKGMVNIVQVIESSYRTRQTKKSSNIAFLEKHIRKLKNDHEAEVEKVRERYDCQKAKDNEIFFKHLYNTRSALGVFKWGNLWLSVK